jgi:hypothetical protein
VFAIDGQETWLVHNHLNARGARVRRGGPRLGDPQILGVGADFEYEVISKEDWVGRRLVANRFRDRNVFIAGDAAHLWVPYAGYGMNAGIADAVNLSWLLAARLQGWGDRGHARRLRGRAPAHHRAGVALCHGPCAEDDQGAPRRAGEHRSAGRQGDAARAEIGQEAYDLNVQQFCCAGLNFGYYYERLALIVSDDGEAPPPYTMGGFTPSTVPGLPRAAFLAGRRPLAVRRVRPGYTLLRFDAALDVTPLLAAARAQGVPLAVLDVQARDAVPAAYRHPLVLCRADQHVVWRGEAVPADAAALVAVLRGARFFWTTASACAVRWTSWRANSRASRARPVAWCAWP